MRLARTRLWAVTLAVLLSQAGVAVVSGIAFSIAPAQPARSAAAPDDHACCRRLAPGRTCPMHKGGKATAHADQARKSEASCRLSSGCAPKAVVLTVVMTTPAVMPAVYDGAFGLSTSSAVAAAAADASSWIIPPPVQPPRA